MAYFVGAFIALVTCANALGWYIVLKKLKDQRKQADPAPREAPRLTEEERRAADLERQFQNLMSYNGKPQEEYHD